MKSGTCNGSEMWVKKALSLDKDADTIALP